MRVARREWLIGSGAALLGGPAFAAPRAPLVLAAASLQESLTAAADAWTRKGHASPVLSFAASSALARQIAAGAAADLFLSADEPWMDAVERRGRLVPGTRVAFLGNRLAVIQPAGALPIPASVPLRQVLASGRIAMADPDAVPAGKYGKAALQTLGIWDAVAPRVVRGDSVRAALALVERGAAQWGLVYMTDAQASPKVRAFRQFPPSAHPPIRYPIARLKSATSPDAEPLRRFLAGREGKAVFARFGFTPL